MEYTSPGDNPHNRQYVTVAEFTKKFCERLETEPKYRELPEAVAAKLRASALKLGGISTGLANTEVEERSKQEVFKWVEAIASFGQELKKAGFAFESRAIENLAETAMKEAQRFPEDQPPRGRQL